jgi:ATPase family AAA domain-containing protein 3A/B
VQVFELMRKQEETRLSELEAEKVQYAIHERLRDMVSS